MKLLRRQFLVGFSLSALVAASPEITRAARIPHGSGSVAAGSPQTLIGLEGVTEGMFANWAKSIGHTANVFLTNNYPAVTNNDGYPTSTSSLAANVPDANGFVLGLPTEYSGNWVCFWTGQGAFQLSPPGTAPRTVEVGTSGFVQSSNFNLVLAGTMNGTTDKVVFNWGSNPPPAQAIAIYFPGGFAYSTTTQMSGLVICRAADEAICRANLNAFLPEYIANLKTLNPRTIRLMDAMATNGSNRAQSKYDPATTALTFGNDIWNSNTNVGAISGSTIGGVDTYVCGSYPDMPGVWTDKEQFQGQINFASTGAPATITVGGRSGAKTIVGIALAPLTAGFVQNGSLVSFTYDAFLNVCIIFPGGYQRTLPIAIGVTLANAIGCDLWWNFPHLVDNASVTSEVNYAKANMAGGHRCLFEYSNEVWNPPTGGNPFYQYEYALARGNALGVNAQTGTDTFPLWSFYGYRVQQIGTVLAAARGASTNIKMVLASQGYTGGNAADQLRFQGLFTGTGAPIQVTGITNANPAVVTTATAHGLSVNQIVCIQGNAASSFSPVTGMTVGASQGFGPINGLFFTVGSTTSNTFILKNVINAGSGFLYTPTAGSTNIDSTSYGTYTGGGYVYPIPLAPNRPIDISDVISFATYTSGDTFTNGNYGAAPNMAAFNSAAASYVSGGAGIATGLNWIDNDYQVGTMSGAFGSQTVLGINNNIYPQWNALAGKYSGKSIECYEGGCEMAIPAGSQYTSLGFSSLGNISVSLTSSTFTATAHGMSAGQPVCLYANANGVPFPFSQAGNVGPFYYVVSPTANTFQLSLTPGGPAISTDSSTYSLFYSIGAGNAAALLLGYKNDSRFFAATTNQLSQMKAGSTNGTFAAPGWFQLYGPGQWACWTGDALSNSPQQSWNAMAAFN